MISNSQRRIFILLVRLGTFALIGLSVSGWFQAVHPLLDTASHFRVLAMLALVVGLIVCLWVRQPGWAVAAGVTIAISATLTAPYLPGFKRGYATPQTAAKFEQLVVVQMNMLFNNPRPEDAGALLLGSDADVILLQEVTRKTEVMLDILKTRYPHQLSCQTDRFGSVAIVSSLPFLDGGLRDCLRREGYAAAQIVWQGKPFTLATFHSRWPYPAGQGRQMARLRGRFSTLPEPKILAGDFNSTPWSDAVQRVAQWSRTAVLSGLIHSWGPRLAGRSNGNPWPMLPIDQTMVSDGVGPVSRQRLESGGSDHFAIRTVVVFDASLKMDR
ncbi:endonuclease/exonuclease/phosphatase family protein [Ahrensia sp. R2A130]|uniref:endonuclease/exonuclease/phosphatase family protein n=1 Tax=Ahrensia sp. R2A130 TaxID=744979 RepID=UPI0001E0F0D8|nr:endonuclease/exonuclease/phosphatase family protein [Ahrensia sp. R2A130]EFL88994.1 putative endonuclease/exonuclease/phosphatase [Ahrensia sp. R2A130]